MWNINPVPEGKATQKTFLRNTIPSTNPWALFLPHNLTHLSLRLLAKNRYMYIEIHRIIAFLSYVLKLTYDLRSQALYFLHLAVFCGGLPPCRFTAIFIFFFFSGRISIMWIYHGLFNVSRLCGYFPHYSVVTHRPAKNK